MSAGTFRQMNLRHYKGSWLFPKMVDPPLPSQQTGVGTRSASLNITLRLRPISSKFMNPAVIADTSGFTKSRFARALKVDLSTLVNNKQRHFDVTKNSKVKQFPDRVGNGNWSIVLFSENVVLATFHNELFWLKRAEFKGYCTLWNVF